MKDTLTELDQWREPHPITGYIAKGDTCGSFRIPHYDYRERDRKRAHFIVIASSGEHCGWDHVSVHVRTLNPISMRMPTWGEMCWIKRQFFTDEETVIQFHPKASEYVNTNPYTLHLWKPYQKDIDLPPTILI